MASLSSAIARLDGGYAFTTAVSVDGKVATQAIGRWIGGSSEFVVTTNGTSITYRSLPPNSWVLQAGQGWVQIDGSIPSGSPLDALRSPGQVSLTGNTGGAQDLTATYPAAALGLAGSGTVPVQIHLAADGSLTATYSAPTGSATSTTTITPQPDQAAIVAPSPGPASSGPAPS